jgi:hypothetical protein
MVVERDRGRFAHKINDRSFPLLDRFRFFTSLLKQQFEGHEQLFHGFGIGHQFESDTVISGDGFPVIHPVLTNGLRDPMRKGITRREAFSISPAFFVLITTDRA